MEYRRLGRTQLQVSAIGFGTCQLRLVPEKQATETLLKGFELGVNLVHTAPYYGKAEEIVTRTVRESGHPVVVASSGYDVPGNESGPVVHFERLFETTCERLGAERLDLYGIDCIDARETQRENVWGGNGMVDFLLKKKEEGRLGGIFCTTHGAPEYVARLVASGAFDAIMLAYNVLGYHLLHCNPYYRQAPPPDHPFESLPRNQQELFPRCREHDVGLMVMKPLAGGLLCESKALPPRNAGRSGLGRTSVRDILRSILLHPEVSCVVPGTASVAEAEENALSGCAPVALAAERREELAEVVAGLKRTVCSRCGACDAQCSQGLPISWIFWAGLLELYPSMAFEKPEEVDYFRFHPRLASVCATCPDVTCVCPHGIDIPRRRNEIHSVMADLLREQRIPPPDTMKGEVHGDHSFGARIASVEIPRTMEPGEAYVCRIRLENAGERGWHPAANAPARGYRARVALAVYVDDERRQSVEVGQDVHQGQRWHTSFEITAPRGVARFRLRLQLLGEHQQFSESLGPVVFSEEIAVERKN